jgi:glycosyl-4,4'-diaponeurosporenoate acyltransferase
MRVVELPLVWTVVLDVAAWGTWSTVCGLVAWRYPAPRLASDGPLTRLREVERGGRFYERLGIRRWKDRLPEAGALFPGGVSKRRVGGTTREALARFATETRRAELTHWWVMTLGPFFVLWNPPELAAVMVAYAVVANLPCIAIQRFNRARISRMTRPT